MIYIKIMQGDTVITAEAHETPVYVCQQKNGIIARCSEQKAQGILSVDGSTIYQLNGKEALNLDNDYTAYFTYMTEYEEILSNKDNEDTEDSSPDVPENTSEEEILTRAELTVKVKALEEELTAAKILLGVE